MERYGTAPGRPIYNAGPITDSSALTLQNPVSVDRSGPNVRVGDKSFTWIVVAAYLAEGKA